MFHKIHQFEEAAKKSLDQAAYDYIAGAAGDESGLERAEEDWQNVHLLNRVLAEIKAVNTETTLLGKNYSYPLMIAPTAYQSMYHQDGEVGMAKAAKSYDIPMILSTFSTIDLEEVRSQSQADLWFQLYFYKDRELTKALVQRAEEAGYQAIVLTVDVPVLGIRYRDRINQFKIPPQFQAVNIAGKDDLNQLTQGEGSSLETFIQEQLKRDLSWSDVDWLKSVTKLPILLKGILDPRDATKAVDSGVDGIIVSNHGARQLDALVSPVKTLPKIAEAVGGKVDVLVDGGIRSGSDVLKSLCLGAKAVLIGRPTLWGLAVSGQSGVEKVLEILTSEIKVGLPILGVENSSDLDRSFVFK